MFEIIFQIPDHVPAHCPATLVLCSLGSHRKVGKYSGENNNIDDNNILWSLGSHRQVGKTFSGENNDIDDNENDNNFMPTGFSLEGENIFWRK